MALAERQLANILALFDSERQTIASDWLVRSLRKDGNGGYQHPNRLLRDAIEEDFLYVDSFDENGISFLGMTESGVDHWRIFVTEGEE
jgi:hypothetical protein